ncbi:uncharacterized protein B0H18DRAFT_671430 [Fomitopsis serialis]|uniref:uncharacterized protein n=1 Tax=Fomitopsis serialis TaxID=139415 RepID=UPI0020076CC0|nr:uncharacterized protein B0H18DRAFT_671430 [Neoantrodia serialis]KAH9932912.1 hypothetical protein B0H18DRAFT_671430 [Neoantrodia serialis]
MHLPRSHSPPSTHVPTLLPCGEARCRHVCQDEAVSGSHSLATRRCTGPSSPSRRRRTSPPVDSSHAHRGPKRPLPLRRRKGNVTVQSIDSTAQQTEWKSGQRQTRWIQTSVSRQRPPSDSFALRARIVTNARGLAARPAGDVRDGA